MLRVERITSITNQMQIENNKRNSIISFFFNKIIKKITKSQHRLGKMMTFNFRIIKTLDEVRHTAKKKQHEEANNAHNGDPIRPISNCFVFKFIRRRYVCRELAFI